MSHSYITYFYNAFCLTFTLNALESKVGFSILPTKNYADWDQTSNFQLADDLLNPLATCQVLYEGRNVFAQQMKSAAMNQMC